VTGRCHNRAAPPAGAAGREPRPFGRERPHEP
jgi:hypothetical protein